MKFTGLLVSSFAALAVANSPSGQSYGEEAHHPEAYGDSYAPSKHAEPYMQKVESTSTVSRYPMATGYTPAAEHYGEHDNITMPYNSTHHAKTSAPCNSTYTTATTMYNSTTPVAYSHPTGTGNAYKAEYNHENMTTSTHGHTTPVAYSHSTATEYAHHMEYTTSTVSHSSETPMTYGHIARGEQAYHHETAAASYYAPPANTTTSCNSTVPAYTHYSTTTVTTHAGGYHSKNTTTSVETTITISTTTTFAPEAYKHKVYATGSYGWPINSANCTTPVGTAPPKTTLSTITKSASTYLGYGHETTSASYSAKTWSSAEGYKGAYEA